MDNQTILNIINQVKKGENDAFRLLVDAHKDMVYSLSLKMARSTEDAEEIAQDAFIKAFQGIHRFKGKSKFSTWLYQITYYTAINFLRKKKIVTREFDLESVEMSDEVSFSSLQQKDRKKYIQLAFEYLKPDERAVMTLYYLEENSMEEVAEITKLSLSNVKVKIHRVRKKLLQIMQGLLKNELNSLV